MGHFLLFLYGNKNLVGSVLALGAYFGGVIHDFCPVIVGGSYAIGYLGAPRSQELETTLNAQMDAQAIHDGLQRLVRDAQRGLPSEAVPLVQSIASSIDTILPTLASSGVASQNSFDIRRTATEYLPQTLTTYLALPPAYRNLQPLADGKTAKSLLVEQLTLLDAKMKEISTNVFAHDSQALLENGAFLRDRFADSSFLKPV